MSKYYLGLTATVKGFQIVLWDESFLMLKEKIVFNEFFHRVGLEEVERFLNEFQAQVKDLQGIIVDTGPSSSFTGLRLSVAIAKTISYIDSCKLYEVSSLALFVKESVHYNPILRYQCNISIMKGYQSRVFLATFDGITQVGKIQDVPIDRLEPLVHSIAELYKDKQLAIMGNGVDHCASFHRDIESLKYILPLDIPKISFLALEDATKVDFNDLLPRYYRLTQAEEAREQ